MRVSVITPTWQRADLLLERCMPSVLAQTWADVEHVIVSDGPDRPLAEKVALDLWRRPLKTRPVQFVQLAHHNEHPFNFGSRARNRGLAAAGGDYVCYLDDDNAFRPKHVQLLAEALEQSGADFAFSQMQRHPGEDVIGTPPPAYGAIDTSMLMHRRGVPEKFGRWPLPQQIIGDQHAPDWFLVASWLDAGATWVHVPEVTVDYHFRGDS